MPPVAGTPLPVNKCIYYLHQEIRIVSTRHGVTGKGKNEKKDNVDESRIKTKKEKVKHDKKSDGYNGNG